MNRVLLTIITVNSNMIIIRLSQQLGNQMFQYALGRQLEQLGKKVKYSFEYYKKHPEHPYELSRVFGLDLPEATEEEVRCLRDTSRRMMARIRRKIFGRHSRVCSEIKTRFKGFKSSVFDSNRVLLDGYWQSVKYFSQVADLIHEDFTFRLSSSRNTELAEEMKAVTSVSIHVRRGDYLGSYPLLTEDYYMLAKAYFLEKYANVHFYVFSNDIPWCHEHLKTENTTFVDWNTGKDSPLDMWLMTQCKHNIIANSSFSWWGAWLNRNEGKEVIAPRVWHKDPNKNPDIYCPGWIVL